MERLVTMKGDSRKGEQGVDTGQVGITKTGRQEEIIRKKGYQLKSCLARKRKGNE